MIFFNNHMAYPGILNEKPEVTFHWRFKPQNLEMFPKIFNFDFSHPTVNAASQNGHVAGF